MGVVLPMQATQGPFRLNHTVRRATEEELESRGIILDLLGREHYRKVLQEGHQYEAEVICYPRYGGGYTCYYLIDFGEKKNEGKGGQKILVRELDCKLFVLVM